MFVVLVLVVTVLLLLRRRGRRREDRTFGRVAEAMVRPSDGPRFARFPGRRS